jgi:hypothetical protein
MRIIRGLVLVFLLVMLFAACVSAPDKERAKVHCPACGTDFDALYQKRF